MLSVYWYSHSVHVVKLVGQSLHVHFEIHSGPYFFPLLSVLSALMNAVFVGRLVHTGSMESPDSISGAVVRVGR